MMEIILTSSVLILILALLRRLLRGRVDPRLQYALWLLVVARLLMPGSLFPVPVSVAGAAEDLRVSIRQAFPDPDALPDLPAADLTGQSAQPSQPLTPEAGTAAGYQALWPEAARRTDNWPDILWKAGIVLMGGALVLSNLGFYLQLRRKRERLNLPQPAGAGRLPVYLVRDLPSPCLFGLFRPAIYLPAQALEPGCLEHILTHERTHFRHGDHLWALLRGLCLTIHWYNPLVWWAAALSRRDCELACDDGVIRRLGEESRLDYGETLLHMVAAGRTGLLRTATTMSGGKRTMAERIALIARRPRMLKATLALVAVVICAAVVLTFGGAAERLPAEDGPAEPTGDQAVLPPEGEETARPISSGQLSSTVYAHPSGLFTLTLPDNWLAEVRYAETEDGVSFYRADAGEGEGLLMSVAPQPVSWAEVYDRNGISLEEFDCNGSPYVYMLDLNGEAGADEHTQSLLAQGEQVARGFRGQVTAEAFSRLVHDAYPVNMPLAVAYLPYLNWSSYLEVYGEEEMGSLLEALFAYVADGDLDWGQYHDILSNRSRYQPIDGAYATAIEEGIIWPLYEKNPQRFASVLGSVYLTDDERADVLDWLRFPLSYDQGRSNFPEEDLTNEEMYEILGLAPTAGGVTASPSARTLTSAGERFAFLPEGAVGVYAATYTSSDPSVASVDQAGSVTAVSPGQAVITLHFEGSGGQQDFTCAVTCAWTEDVPPAEDAADDPAETLYGETYGWEMMNQWQQRLFGLTFSVLAMPDQEQIYDDAYSDGVERSVLALLEDYGRECLGDDFDSVILDSALPLNPAYREAVAVTYRLVAAREFQFPDGRTVRLTQDSQPLETTFTLMSSSQFQGQMLSDGPGLYDISRLSDAAITGADNWNLAYIHADILSRTQAKLLANAGTADYTVRTVDLIDDGALEDALLAVRAGDTLDVQYNISLESPSGSLSVGTLLLTYTFAE